jgi:hypothetical protein
MAVLIAASSLSMTFDFLIMVLAADSAFLSQLLALE